MWDNDAMQPILGKISRAMGVLVIGAALLLSACGEKGDKKQAKKAANALSDYYYAQWRPPSPDWKVQKVKIGKNYVVNIETEIVTKTLSKAIMERSRMEQMEIARLACPAPNGKIWDSIDKDQAVNIRLSGVAGHIINSLCKRFHDR